MSQMLYMSTWFQLTKFLPLLAHSSNRIMVVVFYLALLADICSLTMQSNMEGTMTTRGAGLYMVCYDATAALETGLRRDPFLYVYICTAWYASLMYTTWYRRNILYK